MASVFLAANQKRALTKNEPPYSLLVQFLLRPTRIPDTRIALRLEPQEAGRTLGHGNLEAHCAVAARSVPDLGKSKTFRTVSLKKLPL